MVPPSINSSGVVVPPSISSADYSEEILDSLQLDHGAWPEKSGWEGVQDRTSQQP